jgi:hypothetical protein
MHTADLTSQGRAAVDAGLQLLTIGAIGVLIALAFAMRERWNLMLLRWVNN